MVIDQCCSMADLGREVHINVSEPLGGEQPLAELGPDQTFTSLYLNL